LADRFPIFELHVLPMFRQIDRQHMLRVNSKLDLLDYDSVKKNAPDILSFAGGDAPTMPPSGVGGPWPSEWKALFARWIAGGHRRLLLGTAQNLKLARSVGTTHQLSCTVTIPNAPDAAAWFDVVDPGPAAATYRLYVFAGETVPPPTETTDITVKERLDAATAANGVTVIDAAGSHRVTEPVA
jgi:hypothetical protein